jgi:hypothetical protein
MPMDVSRWCILEGPWSRQRCDHVRSRPLSRPSPCSTIKPTGIAAPREGRCRFPDQNGRGATTNLIGELPRTQRDIFSQRETFMRRPHTTALLRRATGLALTAIFAVACANSNDGTVSGTDAGTRTGGSTGASGKGGTGGTGTGTGTGGNGSGGNGAGG